MMSAGSTVCVRECVKMCVRASVSVSVCECLLSYRVRGITSVNCEKVAAS